MAGRIITNSPVGAADWTDEVETKNIGKKGLYNMAFTNMLTDGQPEIIAGSSVDVDGVIIVFDSNETITGSVTSGSWYVVVKADGTAEFIDETPIFDDAKKGYYDTSGNRFALGFQENTYSDKTTFTDFNKALGDIKADSINTDNFGMKMKTLIGTTDANGVLTVPHGLDYTKIISVTAFFDFGSNTMVSFGSLLFSGGLPIGSSIRYDDVNILCVHSDSSAYNKSCAITITHQI